MDNIGDGKGENYDKSAEFSIKMYYGLEAVVTTDNTWYFRIGSGKE